MPCTTPTLRAAAPSSPKMACCIVTALLRPVSMDPIKSFLDRSTTEYEFIYHERQILSAADGVRYLGIEAGQTAPALIISTDNNYFSLVFSGSRRRIDFVALAAILGVSKVKLVDNDKVQSIIGFTPGDIPMVGLALPIIFDKKLLQYSFVYGGSGQPNRTLKLSPDLLQKLVQPVAFLDND